MKLQLMVAALTVAGACVVCAEDVQVWSGSGTSASWKDAANWRDGSGAVPSSAPTDGSRPVAFPALPVSASPYKQTVGIDISLSVGRMTDDEPLAFRRVFSDSATTLNFLEAQSYPGYWKLAVNTALSLVSGSTLDMVCGGSLVVPTVSSGSAEISSLGGRTTLAKAGAGNLVVGSAATPETIVHVEKGTVTLLGKAADLAPAPGAALHLDASQTNSFETTVGDDGRVYVNRWNDVDGRDASAFEPKYTCSESWSIPASHAPFISPETANGLPLVDFGAAKAESVDCLGPQNCVLSLVCGGKDITKAREVFYVAWITDTASENFVLGGYVTYDYYRYGNKLFVEPYANKGVFNGDIYLNGRKQAGDYSASEETGDDLASLHVLSVGSSCDTKVGLLASDRYYAGRTGGMRLGEVLIYTNNLTTAQRLATHRYLMEKWLPADKCARADYDAVSVKYDNASGDTIEVPDGRVARVAQLSLSRDNKLVKTGSGRLEIEALATADAKIEVQGGSAVVVGSAPFADDCPAFSPTLWLDATVSNSLFRSEGTHVSKWADCRDETGETAYVTAGKDRGASEPYVLSQAQNQHDTVCLGTSASDRGYFCLPSTLQLREGFVAIKLYTDSTANIFCGDGYDLNFYRDAARYLLNPTYAAADGRAARWAVDGVVKNPVRDYTLPSDGSWRIVNFTSLKKLGVKFLGIDGRPGMSNAYGCMEIGEVLLYERLLTPVERRRTEAYLMKRWLAKDHPAKEYAVSSLTFADGVPMEFENNNDMKVASVKSKSASLVKRGDGRLVISSMSDSDAVVSVSVEGGTLVTPFPAKPDTSVFHFDALDADTMQTSLSADGDVVRTNVVTWSDVRRNGVVATAETPAHGNASVASPTLQVGELRSGVVRPYVDFGLLNEVWDESKKTAEVLAKRSAGMKISAGSTSVREAYVVFADQPNSGSHQHFFTDSTQYHFHRGGAQLFNGTYAAEFVRNGYIAIDGVASAYNATYPSGFHLLSVAPTGDAAISTIAADRMYNGRGGCRVCELVVYNTALTDADRKFMLNRLRYKWFGEGVKQYVAKKLDSLTVREGCLYRNSDSQVSLDVASFAGGGTVDFERVAVTGGLSVGDTSAKCGSAQFTGDLCLGDGSQDECVGGTALSMDFISTWERDTLFVVGTFVQNGPITLWLSVPGKKALPDGEYTIIWARALSGVDLSKWTIKAPEGCRRTFSLYCRNGVIGVCVGSPGMTVIVR